jgi:Zn finger protein HypA/HybF involved in hydrogenase expression
MTRNTPLQISEFNATIKCRDCEIFIGPGHFDAVPVQALDQDGYLCGACHQAEERRRRGGWRAVVWGD